ncbi:hypothetical protein LCGC14_0340980 [marine sediment metagenome]|uniref:Glycosyltransferase 2-like domain-containing protein n=1 Tax=marine sediment metagenome TaxID=412755 RepID=A0A0F9W0Y6_9ZZZZ
MLIVALPAYNEERYIKAMITKVKQYADEVIVVNDGSNDDTAKIAELNGATVVSHPENLGYGATIISILNEAKKREFDALVIIDADSQHEPRDIPKLVTPIFNGYDLVIGARNWKDIPFYRYVGGKVLSIFTRILSGANVSDSQSGFRAYSVKAVKELEPKEKGMAISSEIVSLATKHNLKIIEVPISIKYTKDSSTINPVVQGFYTLFRIMVMIWERRVLK